MTNYRAFSIWDSSPECGVWRRYAEAAPDPIGNHQLADNPRSAPNSQIHHMRNGDPEAPAAIFQAERAIWLHHRELSGNAGLPEYHVAKTLGLIWYDTVLLSSLLVDVHHIR
jgi:hypothetical protein